MEMLEWMYQISRISHPFIQEVTKFVDIARKHALSVNRQGIICRVLSLQERACLDARRRWCQISLDLVRSRLGIHGLEVSRQRRCEWCIRRNIIVRAWYHGGGASSGRHGVVGKDDFIMMDNFVQDTVNDGVTMMMLRIMVRRFWRTLSERIKMPKRGGELG